MRERGNFPARIHVHIVGYDTPTRSMTSRRDSSCAFGGDDIAVLLVRVEEALN
jgi:hypothetical protein